MSPTQGSSIPAGRLERLVRPLSEVGLRHRGELGGKAAVLGELLAREMPVLPGIAISCSAYEAVFREPTMAPLATAYWKPGDDVDRKGISAEIGRQLAANPLPSQLGATILPMLESLGIEGDLIVRSSATAEDGRRSSFAGQFLSVRSSGHATALGEAIAAVWASATSSHVAEYLGHLSSPNELRAIAMGILVQPFQEFEVAGVLFSQHPTVRLADWALVEFLDAPPDQIVGGEVTPHRVRLRMSDGKVLWEHRAQGDVDLTQQAARELAEYSSGAAEILAADIDMEWGLHEGAVIVLQARPATLNPWGQL